ncbi:MAG: ATP-binding protein [Acidobacteriota bacterium]
MSVFLFLVLAACLLVLSAPLLKRKRAVSIFDPGMPPERLPAEAPAASPKGLHLGGALYWSPEAHPNPHVLIVGGSGSGKTWAMRWLAVELVKRGYRCILFDFHGDLHAPGTVSYRIAADSQYGVNPLDDPQRFEVLELLRNTFRPMGTLQLALLDECLKETYTRSQPHFGDLLEVLQSHIQKDPGNLRLQELRTKLSLAFDLKIFSKPAVPLFGDGSVHLDLTGLPAALQFLASDTLLRQILRRRQLGGPLPLSVFVLVDESKLCTPADRNFPSSGLNRIATEGRKFGLGLVVSSQFVGHLGRDVVVNTFTKIVMKTDRTEISATARRFRLEPLVLETLERPGHALVHFADSTRWEEVQLGSRAS